MAGQQLDAALSYESLAIWPLYVRLPTKAGYTLWGDGGGQSDQLLAVSHSMLLFRAPESLRRYVLDADDHNFMRLPNYHALREYMGAVARVRPDSRFDLLGVVETLSKPGWQDWSFKTCASVLNALNMAWDMSKTVKDRQTEQLMTRRGLLGKLADVLVFMDDEHRHELRQFDRDEVLLAYKGALMRIAAKTLQVC